MHPRFASMERGTRNAQAQKAMPCRQLTGEKLLANWTAKILQLGSKKGVCLPSPGLQRSERSAFHAIRVVTKTKTGTGTKTKTGTGVIHIMRQSGRKRSGARSDNPCGNGILVVTLHRQKPETPPKGMEGGRRKKNKSSILKPCNAMSIRFKRLGNGRRNIFLGSIIKYPQRLLATV